MIWSGRSIGEQNRGIKRVVIYCWVRGLSSKYICIYGVLRASVSPQFQLEWDHWILGAHQLEQVPCVEVSVCTTSRAAIGLQSSSVAWSQVLRQP